MTVVRFPTRITATIVADRALDPQLQLAVDAAAAGLERAISRAASLRLLRHHTPEDARTHVTVRFAGTALPAEAERTIDARLRALAEQQAAALLDRLATPGTRDAGARGDATERYDGERLIADAGADADSYVLPSYGDRGLSVAVPLRGGDRGSGGELGWTLRMHEFSSRQELEDWIIARYDPPPTRLVALVSQRGRPTVWLCAMDGHTLAGWRRLGELRVIDPRTATERALQVYRADELRFVRDAASHEDVRAQRLALLKEHSRREAGGAQGQPVDETALDRRAQSLLARLAPPKLPVRYLELTAGGETIITIETDDASPATRGALPVAVMSERAAREAPAEREKGMLPLEELPLGVPDPSKPFLAEPRLDFWPPQTFAAIEALIADVAQRLGMRPGVYPAMFALAASARIAALAPSYGALAGTGEGDTSPRTHALARLAEACAPLERLVRDYTRLIDDGGDSLPVPLRGNTASWMLHFFREYAPRRDTAIGALFAGACQDVLLQRLEASHRELSRHVCHFDAYMIVARVTIRVLLADDHDLRQLRSVLTAAELTPHGIEDAAVGTALGALADAVTATRAAAKALHRDEAMAQWIGAASALVDAMAEAAHPSDAVSAPVWGRVRTTKWGVIQVQDATGTWWSRAQLDGALGAARKEAFTADPLLEKVADLPEVVERLRAAGPDGLDAEFRSLLVELGELNEKKTAEARTDRDLAIGLAQFTPAEAAASDIGAHLTGIHVQADAFLRPLFPGYLGAVYTTGVASLAATEMGRQAFHRFFGIVGIGAIAIFCPPLAFAIGVVESTGAVLDANEHLDIQRAMLGSEDILTLADAEAERWGAWLGLALAFLPEAKSIARGAAGAAKATWKRELITTGRTAARRAAQGAVRHAAESLTKELAVVFAKECLTSWVLDLAINAAMERVTDAVKREVDASGKPGLLDVPAIVEAAFRGAPETRP